jgi:tetratricopeptide (TPR) repeat protein
VKYCHSCGCKLSSDTEKFCPECGQNLTQEKTEANGIDITDTKGDVIGVGIKGTGHFIGKEIGYTVQGNVIQLNISSNISKEVIDSLQKIINMPTQIDQKSLTQNIEYDKDNKNKLYEINNTQKQITSLLQEVDNIGKKEGTQPIEVIRSEGIQISRKELLLKEHIIKGNEYYYKKEYNNAIQCFDKAVEIDPNNAYAWYNKGAVLGDLLKHNEAIQCFDKAVEIGPNNAYAWSYKGVTLYKLGKRDESIQCYDKALEINPNNASTWNNKGLALDHLRKYDDAIQCYDKAVEIDPNNDLFNENRNIVLEKLGKTEKKSGWKRFLGR